MEMRVWNAHFSLHFSVNSIYITQTFQYNTLYTYIHKFLFIHSILSMYIHTLFSNLHSNIYAKKIKKKKNRQKNQQILSNIFGHMRQLHFSHIIFMINLHFYYILYLSTLYYLHQTTKQQCANVHIQQSMNFALFIANNSIIQDIEILNCIKKFANTTISS